MTEQKYKLDIFKVLERLSVKDRKYFANLSEEEMKSLQPLVLMRWMSGTSDSRQVYFLNELCNPLVFPLTKHKKLLLDLLMISSSGKNKRYIWNKAKGKTIPNTPKAVSIIKEHFGYNTREALDVLKILSNEEILDIAEQHGKQVDEIKELSKELKGRNILVD